MRNWELIVYTLRGCGHCDELKRGLTRELIGYNEICISDNDEIGDRIEKQFGCENYPMVELKHPFNIVWISQISLIHSPIQIRIYSTIEHLINQIKNINEQ
jgi:glutaredoxin